MADPNNTPQPGTPEYDQMMKEYYGESYELGYRVSFGKRLGAFIVDLIFLGIVGTIVASATGFIELMMDLGREAQMSGQLFMSPEDMPAEAISEITTASIYVSLSFLVYWLLEIFLSASFGKLVLGLKIGSAERTEANMQQLIIRFVVRHIGLILSILGSITAVELLGSLSSLGTLIFVIGSFFILSNKRQAVHDIAGKTAVYHKNSLKGNQ